MRQKLGVVLGTAALALCALAGLTATPSGARSTHSSRSADSYFAVSLTGPTSVGLSYTVAPPRQEFDATLDYIGPAFQPGDGPVQGTINFTLSAFEKNPGVGCCVPPADCLSVPQPPQNAAGVTWSCPFQVGPGNPTHYTFPFGARPTGVAGTGPTTFWLSTGASASVTTTYYYADTTPTTTTTPDTTPTTTTAAPVAAAPPTTVTDTFAPSTPPQTESVALAPTADAATVGLSWPTSADSFDVTNIAIVNNGVVVARAPQSATGPKKLVVVKHRTPTSLTVSIKNLTRGKLRFKIVPREVAKTTRVKATIRQTKRR